MNTLEPCTGIPITVLPPMMDCGYSPRWIAEKMSANQTHEKPRITACMSGVFSIMTKPIDSTSGFWNVVEKLTRILTLTLVPWISWITYQSFDHAKEIAIEKQWRVAHEDVSKERITQIERMDKELQEWRLRFNIFSDETRNGLRSTDTTIRDVAARLSVMSDTLIRMQEGQSAIREKMVNIQVVTDELNKGGSK